jgi:hypothetical protein
MAFCSSVNLTFPVEGFFTVDVVSCPDTKLDRSRIPMKLIMPVLIIVFMTTNIIYDLENLTLG